MGDAIPLGLVVRGLTPLAMSGVFLLEGLKTPMKNVLGVLLILACNMPARGGDALPYPPRVPATDISPLQTVQALDLQRYMGTWYEIAKFPNRFQAKCASNTKATYSIKEGGQVQVINSCRLESGDLNEAEGAARQVGGGSSPKLEVRFAPAWLSFIPAVWGNYWVIDLDDDYQLVAVSEPKREYLWVLARTKRVQPEKYSRLLDRLTALGFNLNRLEVSKQD